MRVLALSDLHGEEAVLERLSGLLQRERFDLILIVGDITQRGPVSYAEDLLDAIGEENILAIHGNMDTQQVIGVLEKEVSSSI